MVSFIPTSIFAMDSSLTYLPTRLIDFIKFKIMQLDLSPMFYKYDQPCTKFLKCLHWLPIRARIMFKILVLVFRIVQGTAQSYLRSSFNRVPQTYSLRSSDEIDIQYTFWVQVDEELMSG